MRETRFKNPWLHYGLLSIIYGLGVLTVAYHVFLHGGDYKTFSANCLQVSGRKVTVSVSDKGFDPEGLNLKLCDQVVFVNDGTVAVQPALGRHPNHTNYPGWIEAILMPGEGKALVLTETGNYSYHDHLNESSKGHLSVAR